MSSGKTSRRGKDGRLMTPAQRLDGFLDRTYQGSRSSHHTMSRGYDPVNSWDAMSDCGSNNHTLQLKNQSELVFYCIKQGIITTPLNVK